MIRDWIKMENREMKRVNKSIHPVYGRISKFEFLIWTIIIVSLIFDLIFFIQSDLNSDSVHAGILSYDIWTKGLGIICEYRLPAEDTYIFTDTLLFHLIPQGITGFSALSLKASGFIIYILIIIIFSYFIYIITHQRIISLIFAAFFTTIPPASSHPFMIPTCHNATIVFIGILLLIGRDHFSSQKKIFLFSLFLLNIVIFSDSIIILWFLIPIYIWYLLFNRDHLYNNKIAHLLIICSSSITYVIKKFFILQFKHHSESLVTNPEKIISNLKLILNNYVYLYNNYFFHINNKFIIFILILIIILTLTILFNFFLNIWKFRLRKFITKESNLQRTSLTERETPLFRIDSLSSLLPCFLLIPSLIIIFTEFAIYTIRYLTAPFLFALVTLFLGLSVDKPLIKRTLVVLMLVNIGLSGYTIVTEVRTPNADAYHLIESLEKSNLSFGYGEYWDANLITYLSKGRVTVRPVLLREGDIYPFEWLTCDCWYRNTPSEFFLLVGERNRDLLNFSVTHPPEKRFTVDGYEVLCYTNMSLSHISTFDYVTFDEKIQFIKNKMPFPH